MITAELPERSSKTCTRFDNNVVNHPNIQGVKLPQGSLVRNPLKDTIKFSGLKERFNSLIGKKKSDDGQSFEDFENWAIGNKLDLEKLRAIICPENVIANGLKSGIVYKIPGNDKYVLKVPRYNYNSMYFGVPYKDLEIVFEKSQIRSAKIEEVTDICPEVNIGQAIAKIDGNIEVLKKQAGVPLITYVDGTEQEKKKLCDLFIERMKILAKMPQSAYNELARIYKLLEAKGIAVDYEMSNNFLLDTDKKRINIVDASTEINHNIRNNAEHMIIPLLNCDFTIKSKIENSDKINKLRKEILKKCIAACKDERLCAGKGNDIEMEFVFISIDMPGMWPTVCDVINGSSRFDI